jgi:hypothetical protein
MLCMGGHLAGATIHQRIVRVQTKSLGKLVAFQNVPKLSRQEKPAIGSRGSPRLAGESMCIYFRWLPLPPTQDIGAICTGPFACGSILTNHWGTVRKIPGGEGVIDRELDAVTYGECHG